MLRDAGGKKFTVIDKEADLSRKEEELRPPWRRFRVKKRLLERKLARQIGNGACSLENFIKTASSDKGTRLGGKRKSCLAKGEGERQ